MSHFARKMRRTFDGGCRLIDAGSACPSPRVSAVSLCPDRRRADRRLCCPSPMLTVPCSFRGYRDHRVEPAFMPTRKFLSGQSTSLLAIAVSSLVLPALLALSVLVSAPALARAGNAGPPEKSSDKPSDDPDWDNPSDKSKDKANAKRQAD